MQFYLGDRAVYSIADIEIPEELDNVIEVERSIWSFNGKNIEEISKLIIEMIKNNKIRAHYVYQVIDALSRHRPLLTSEICELYHEISSNVNIHLEPKDISKNLCSVLRYKGYIEEKEKYIIDPESVLNIFDKKSIPYIIAWDNIDDLKEAAIDKDFNIHSIYLVINDYLSMLDIAAAYGAEKCFDYLLMNGVASTPELCKYAVMGGSFAIIHHCEREGYDFSECFPIAIAYHRNDVADWILDRNQCRVLTMVECLQYRNTESMLFAMQNGADVNYQESLTSETSFTEACKSENLSVAEYLAKNGAIVDINLQREPGESPLLRACRIKNYDLIEFLLKMGADVNFICGEEKYIQHNAISYACYSNDPEMAEYFLKRGADPNSITIETQGMRFACAGTSVKFYKTPLWITSMWGFFDIVKLLVENGADVNQKLEYINKNGKMQTKTALSLACRGKFPEIAEYLINHGADMNVIVDDDETVLTIAAEKGFLDVVKVLVNHKIDVNMPKNALPLVQCCSRKFPDVAKFLIQNGANINEADIYGDTPLLAAVKSKSLTTVKAIVEEGADLNVNGLIEESIKQNSLEIAKYLVEKKVKVSEDDIIAAIEQRKFQFIEVLLADSASENFKNDIFIKVVQSGEIETINTMLQKGCDFKQVTQNDIEIGLFSALKVGKADSVEFFLKNGANINTVFSERFTPLSHAAYNAHEKLCEFLIKNGADVNLVDKDGYSPLCYAILSKSFQILDMLLNNGADPNITCVKTLPLVLACKMRNTRFCERLMKSGCKVDICGTDGVTPKAAAKEFATPKIIKMVSD